MIKTFKYQISDHLGMYGEPITRKDTSKSTYNKTVYCMREGEAFERYKYSLKEQKKMGEYIKKLETQDTPYTLNIQYVTLNQNNNGFYDTIYEVVNITM